MVVAVVVLDAGRWWYGWVLHWDDVQAGCCMDRTGMMIRWGCAEKNGEGAAAWVKMVVPHRTKDTDSLT